MRSLFAVAASLWFGVLGIGGWITQSDPARVASDPATSAINGTMSFLYIGLAILSLAFVEWNRIKIGRLSSGQPIGGIDRDSDPPR